MNHLSVNSLNFDHESPLHYAIMLNAFKSARALLHLHADPNIVADNGNAALKAFRTNTLCRSDNTLL